MKPEELLELLDSMVSRGRTAPEGPSDRFLMLMRQFVNDARLSDVADAAYTYFAMHPTSRPYISAKLPPMLASSYAPLAEAMRDNGDILLQRERPDWGERIRENISSRNLPAIVDELIEVCRKAKEKR